MNYVVNQTVGPADIGQRIDNYLMRVLKGVPRSHVYRILRRGEVRVNGKRVKAPYRLAEADTLRIPPVRVSPTKAANWLPTDWLDRLAASVIYEDADCLVINKPSGISVHGGTKVPFGVIELMRHLRPDCPEIELVHRIDRETSGCLMIAKRRAALRRLQSAWRAQQVKKTYWCLVKGQVDAPFSCDFPLSKNQASASGERLVRVDHQNGKPSYTEFSPIWANPNMSLLEARLLTGRTHQIRVHLASKAHPIAMDGRYGDKGFNQLCKASGVARLFLHARRLVLKLDENLLIDVVAPLESALQPWESL